MLRELAENTHTRVLRVLQPVLQPRSNGCYANKPDVGVAAMGLKNWAGYVGSLPLAHGEMEPSPLEYVDHAFNNQTFDFKRGNALRCCYEGLKSLPDGLKILDYGTGPSLHETVLTAAKASEIVLSDYSAVNRKALQLWLDNDPAAYDWLPHFRRTLREFEGMGEGDVLERVERMRHVVKAVVHCVLSQDPPIERGYDVPYDLINSCFCLCVASKSHEEYRQGVVKLGRLLKPGGVLMIYESEHKKCQFLTYHVKQHKFYYVAVTSEFV